MADAAKDPLIVENVMELVAEDAGPGTLKNEKIASAGGITEPSKLTLFPNPASGQVQLIFESGSMHIGEIMVMNSAGNLVYKKVASVLKGNNQYNIPVKQLSNGIYLVRVKNGNQVLSGHFFVNNR
jgi:hypothetical protein